jgi:hypothetical protein
MPKGYYPRSVILKHEEPVQDWVPILTPEQFVAKFEKWPEDSRNSVEEIIGHKVTRGVSEKDVKRFEMSAGTLDAGKWAVNNHIFLPSSGNYFSFEGHSYLKEPYGCDAPFQVYLKGGQVGISEMLVIKSLHDCFYRLKSGLIYYFPTFTHVLRFSKARFGPLMKANPIFKQMVKDTNSADMKQVGNCMLHFFGLRGALGAKSTPADKLVFDEIDEVEDPMYVDMANKRLSHSEFQERVFLSTPTVPEFGIDEKFSLTDQRYRMIFCDSCHNYTNMEEDFPESLIMTPEGAKRVCVKCKRELNMDNPKNQYVAKYPGREVGGRPAVGYCISQLHSNIVNMDDIWNEYLTTKYPQDFWNQRIARAYIEVQNRLEVAHVIALCGSHGMEQKSDVPCCIGVDVGPKTHHVVVGRKEYGGTVKILWFGETKPNSNTNANEAWNDLEEIVKRYQGYVVIDGLPEPKKALNFTQQHPYQAWACFYSNSPTTGMRWDDDQKKITVYQSMAMDSSHGMLQDGKVVLPRKSDLVTEFAKHCHNVARKKIEDEKTGSVYNKWIKTGEDHYRKAFSYMVLAMERTPESKFSDNRDYSWVENVDYSGGGDVGDLAGSYAM